MKQISRTFANIVFALAVLVGALGVTVTPAYADNDPLQMIQGTVDWSPDGCYGSLCWGWRGDMGSAIVASDLPKAPTYSTWGRTRTSVVHLHQWIDCRSPIVCSTSATWTLNRQLASDAITNYSLTVEMMSGPASGYVWNVNGGTEHSASESVSGSFAVTTGTQLAVNFHTPQTSDQHNLIIDAVLYVTYSLEAIPPPAITVIPTYIYLDDNEWGKTNGVVDGHLAGIWDMALPYYFSDVNAILAKTVANKKVVSLGVAHANAHPFNLNLTSCNYLATQAWKIWFTDDAAVAGIIQSASRTPSYTGGRDCDGFGITEFVGSSLASISTGNYTPPDRGLTNMWTNHEYQIYWSLVNALVHELERTYGADIIEAQWFNGSVPLGTRTPSVFPQTPETTKYLQTSPAPGAWWTGQSGQVTTEHSDLVNDPASNLLPTASPDTNFATELQKYQIGTVNSQIISSGAFRDQQHAAGVGNVLNPILSDKMFLDPSAVDAHIHVRNLDGTAAAGVWVYISVETIGGNPTPMIGVTDNDGNVTLPLVCNQPTQQSSLQLVWPFEPCYFYGIRTYPEMPTPLSNREFAVPYTIDTYNLQEQGFATGFPVTDYYMTIDKGISVAGNVGVANVTINYSGLDGAGHNYEAFARSDTNGDYNLVVPENWTGTVTPSSPDYTFSPVSRSYTAVATDQSSQSYTSFCSTSASVVIGGTNRSSDCVLANSPLSKTYSGVLAGPVTVTSSGGSIMSSQRVSNNTNGFINEMTGVADNRLTNRYWFPWYDDVNMTTWLLIGNPSATATAHVTVKIANSLVGSYSIAPGASVTPVYSGVMNGPVDVSSDINVFTSERVSKAQGFVNEAFGVGNNQLTTHYWFPWYDNIAMTTWVLVANPSTSATAHVTIKIAGSTVGTYTIAPLGRVTPTYAIQNGPVEITSDINVVTSERVNNNTNGFVQETMGYPHNQLAADYWFPWYDNVGATTWLILSNTSASTATVHVTVAGTEVTGSPFTIAAGGRATPLFSLAGGPMHVTSNVNLVTSLRTTTAQGFVNEEFGVPASQLTTKYWFPWYDNQNMSTDVMLTRP